MPVVETTTIASISSTSRPARVQHAQRGCFQQVERGIEIDAVALRPLVQLLVPLDRHARVAAIDAGVAEHWKQPHDLAGARPERELDATRDLGLTQFVRRNGGSDREDASVHAHRPARCPFRQGTWDRPGNGIPPVSFKPFAAALLGAVLLGAGPRPAPLIIYSAPAGIRPTGADRIHPTSAILPNGRVAAPVGESLFVGADPLGLALSPDGRYAIVSNDGNGSATMTLASGGMLVHGYSLAVVDTRIMKLASVYHDAAALFFMGVAAARDPRDASRTIVLASDGGAGVVRIYDLDAAGQLTPEAQTHRVAGTGKPPRGSRRNRDRAGRTHRVRCGQPRRRGRNDRSRDARGAALGAGRRLSFLRGRG